MLIYQYICIGQKIESKIVCFFRFMCLFMCCCRHVWFVKSIFLADAIEVRYCVVLSSALQFFKKKIEMIETF